MKIFLFIHLIAFVCAVALLHAMIKNSQVKSKEIKDSLYEQLDIEKECLKLQEEREKQEPYLITLWWGFDGLRLNADGSTEWINRRKQDIGLQSTVEIIYRGETQYVQIKDLDKKLKEFEGKRIEAFYVDFSSDIDNTPIECMEMRKLGGYYIVDDAQDFGNTSKAVFDGLQNICTEQIIQAQMQSAVACQNTTLQNMIYAQCQNTPYPSYPIGVSPYMSSHAPYWPYCAGGNFGTYKD